MFGFSDYFYIQKQNTGYANAAEELGDHLRLLDMVLEHYLDCRTRSSEGLIFSRGMKMTEEEIESYFFQPPKERVSLGYDEDFAGEVDRAFTYIRDRSSASGPEVFLPIRECAGVLSLSDHHVFALTMALSVQSDMKYTRLYGYISGEPSMQYPTVGVYQALIETFTAGSAFSDVAELMDPDGAFIRLCIDRSVLLEKKRPYLHTPLVLHEKLLSFMQKGTRAPKSKDRRRLPDSYVALAKKLKKLEQQSAGECVWYYLECEDGRDAGAILSSLSDKPLYTIDAAELLSEESDFIKKLQPILIEAMLQKSRLAIRLEEDISIKRLIPELSFWPVVWVYGTPKLPDELLCGEHGVMASPISIELPDAAERHHIWEGLLADEGVALKEDVHLFDLADTYNFSYTGIYEIAGQCGLFLKSSDEEAMSRAELLSVIFRYNAANFSGLATRVHTAYVWEDMEIVEAQKKRLLVACDRYRLKNRIDEKYGVAKKNAYGNGVSVLMYGAPGTGKTMAAQVVANELGLPLYRVDVSQIFSKYIGETQKNLGVIFEEAKKTNVILFFDEADALFSKRTEVADSNDRYANAETAYLLQKIEEHNGMTILATNLYHNFDSAFVRRITYVVHIDSPDEATRLRLWKHTLPDTMPFASNVDFEFLAERFELSGSNIKSILHTAAYMAGARDRAITMEDLIVSLRYELEKLGRIIDSTDFDNYGVYL